MQHVVAYVLPRCLCSEVYCTKEQLSRPATSCRKPWPGLGALSPSAFWNCQSDRAHLRAVLLALEASLRLLVIVERALDPVGGPVEQVDLSPEKVLEVGLEARFLK